MTDRKNHIKFNAEKDLLLPIVIFLVGLVVLIALGCRYRNNQNSLLQSRAELNAVTYAENVQLDIMQGVNATDTLEKILISTGGKINKFPQIAESMMADFIQSIQLAPNGVVTDIYPAAGNEAGKIDLLNDKDRGEISRYGRDNDVITMQGPFTLKQGGTGIAIRNPVFLDGENGREFWGFTIAIIRVPEILFASTNALSKFGYDYRLSKTKAPWDNTYVEVYGSGEEMENAVTFEFEVGDTAWKLEVQPTDKNSSKQDLYLIMGCGVLIVLLGSGLVTVLVLLHRASENESKTAELNSRLRDAVDLTKTASVAKTKFINNMSHDIRTPMNAIMGYTAIALKNNPEEKTRECLEKISESSEHLLTLINDVLDISRIESGKLAVTPVKTDIRAIIDEVLTITRGTIAGRGLKLEVHRKELRTPFVLADVVHIREVLINVLGNAVKFTRDGGTITFSADYTAEPDGKHIRVSYTVTDTGVGMSEDFQKHIFEEFSQESSDARTQYKGTGLGMTIVKRYTEMMDGTVSVKSKQNVGTRVTIELPLELTDALPLSDTDDAAKSCNLAGLRVMLVEDNDLNAEIAQILLEERGITVVRAADGKQAVDTFSNTPPDTFDAILMDVMMPVMDGLTATRTIRALSRADAKTVPIIAMTANAFAEDVQRCLDAGMNAHLAKPLEINKIISVIARFKH